MDALELDFGLPLRSFRLEVALALGRETFALVGPSGAGKTTVLRAVAGLAKPERGFVRLGGEALFDSARSVDVPPEDRHVGFVFQDYALFPHMTVAQNVAYGARARAPELLERFRIDHLAGARPGELSGGERQRVGLARALAADPPLLLMDEPFGALDAITRSELHAEFKRVKAAIDRAVILVTHDIAEALLLADRVAVLHDGRIIACAPGSELQRSNDPRVAALVVAR